MLDLVDRFPGGLFELFDALAEAFGQFRQLPRAEKDKDEREDQNDLAAAEVEKTKNHRHRVTLMFRKLSKRDWRVKRQSLPKPLERPDKPRLPRRLYDHELATTVFGPGGFIVTGIQRTIFAVADGIDHLIVDTGPDEI